MCGRSGLRYAMVWEILHRRHGSSDNNHSVGSGKRGSEIQNLETTIDEAKSTSRAEQSRRTTRAAEKNPASSLMAGFLAEAEMFAFGSTDQRSSR